MAERDRYKLQGRVYDRLIEPAEKRVRRVCLELWPPKPGQAVVDVGFGTGTQLSFYQRAGCKVAGVDTSPTMFAAARRKLGPTADLRLEDGTRTSFAGETFDLATVMFVLHEMSPAIRPLVLRECRRIVKPDGLILVADYHNGPDSIPQGMLLRGMIVSMEAFGGRDHFRNYRDFISNGAMPPLIESAQLAVVERSIAREGVAGVFLLKKR